MMMKGVLMRLFSLVLGAFMLVGCSSFGQVGFTFTWTAPGDDGNVGTASQYEIRYTQDSGTFVWETATVVPASLEMTPKIAGTPESLTTTLNVQTGRTYYFAIKSRDEKMNYSGISNIVDCYVPDDISPAVVVDFSAVRGR